MNYFESVERQKQLKKILDEWKGTPFRHKCGVKGLGCDCIHFVVCVFEEIGFLKNCKNTIPDYPKDWHIHNTRELLKERLESYNFKRIVFSKRLSDICLNLKNGDLILSHYGKAASHIGIYFDGYVYQALTKIGVKKINFSDKKFRKQMRFAYRTIE